MKRYDTHFLFLIAILIIGDISLTQFLCELFKIRYLDLNKMVTLVRFKCT